MVLTDQINNLFTDIQNCSDATECINFDLTKSLEDFLSHLDKSILEYVEKKEVSHGYRENESDSENEIELEDEKEKESTDQFNSAAVFVEGCVKIFSQKIEYLHNLAHNALYNIYREHKPGNNIKRQFVNTTFEEDYLFVNEMKYLKSSSNEHEMIDDDLLVKTIPFPTFLFHESIRDKQEETNKNLKKKEKSDEEDKTDQIKEHENTQKKDESNNDDKIKEEMEKINEFVISENATISSLNFQKMYLQDEGIILLDLNDYNVFVDGQYDITKQGSNSSALFEKFDYLSKQSLHSSASFTDLFQDINDNNNDENENYAKITDIEDLLSDSICYDYFLFKKHKEDFDLSLGILKNKDAILKKFNDKNNSLTTLEENTHIDVGKFLIIDNNIKCLPHFYSLNCNNIKDYKRFFAFMQPNEIIEIIKENSELKNHKKEKHRRGNEHAEKTDRKIEESNLSNDERIYEEISIPELYIQKLNLNIAYYYIEPLIHNLIKDYRKKKNVEKFFSIDVNDKPSISFEDANEEDANNPNDLKNQEGQNNVTLNNFIGGLGSMNANADYVLGGLENVNSSEKYLITYDDNVHERVSKWNKFLEKKLEILKKQPKFDVDKYKKHIINYTVNNGNKTNFSKLINHKEPYEICRNFLTTLMLINTGVLKINKMKNASSTNDANDYEIRINENKVNQHLEGKIVKNASFVINENKRKKTATVFVPTKKTKKKAVV